MKSFFSRIYLFLVLTAAVITGIFLEQSGLIRYISDPYEFRYITGLLLQHIRLVAISITFATTVGIIVGVIFTRKTFKKYSFIIMYIVGLGQTIPTLAILALSLIILGVGERPAILALFICSILPIARNTLAGINSISPGIIDSACGSGLSPMRVLFEIELPNASEVIINGFRIALIINISTAALGALIGAGGLGELIFGGISLMQTEKILAGAIPTAILALTGDFICRLSRSFIVPKGIKIKS